MKNNGLFLSLIYLYLFVNVKGQDTVFSKSVHLVGIYTGYSKHIIRDDAVSPFIYRGSHAPIDIAYRYLGAKCHHSVNLFYNHLELSSVITDKNVMNSHYAQNYVASFEYAYSRRIMDIRRLNLSCFLGGKFSGFINYRNFHCYSDKSSASAEQFNGIGINLIVEKKMDYWNRNYFHFNIYMPLLSYAILNNRYNSVVSETLNKIQSFGGNIWQIEKDGDIISVNKLTEIQTELSFIKFFSKHVGFELENRFHFYSFTQYKGLNYARYANNQLLFGLIIRI